MYDPSNLDNILHFIIRVLVEVPFRVMSGIDNEKWILVRFHKQSRLKRQISEKLDAKKSSCTVIEKQHLRVDL